MRDLLIPYSELPKYDHRIQELLSRVPASAPLSMQNCQKYLYEVVKKVSSGLTDKTLSRAAIEAEFESDRKPSGFSFNGRNNLITDFCYNMVNLEDNEIKFLFCVDRGLFQFKDFGWACPTGLAITWKVARKIKMTVGEYKSGKYHWQFGELEALISRSRAASKESNEA